MNFDLNEEQVMLRDLVLRFAADRYDPVKRLGYLRDPRGFSAEGWATIAETGLLAFPFAQELGGFGGGAVELITVMEALGRSVAVEPILPVIVMAGGLIERAGSPEQQAELLPAITAGKTFAALAYSERDARYGLEKVATMATEDSAGTVVSGTKQMVLGGPFADDFLVVARETTGAIGIFKIAADAPGVRRRDYRVVDGSVASDLDLSRAPAERLPDGQAALEAALDEARLGICGELMGLMSMIFDSTLDYLKTRNQFGQAIGSFQAVQHRMADHYSRLELSRGQVYRAAAQHGNRQDRGASVSGAKAYISQHALLLAEDAVQLHGGIGTTEELMIGQAFKRVLLLSSLLGDSDWELQRYVALTRH
ncbi:pimeloyl-CoA dehydrogenase small subunit [Sphingobium sp. SCG-1]|uniref:acyl-CoA dehydrogenase family protein n=1 Tax=Sphingobium sp. SCG-1 TaxID=2072936 RepID=UPI000CD6AB39|nr:acyl-CoA dehydrogenase family protein [Sphingobium sp. SCG-1]AUW58928.1 pimeloyl-CoA dehydrogenase small subunit [Sphingobium sp. SCG-1]